VPRKEHEHPLLVNEAKDVALFAVVAGLGVAIAALVAIPSSFRNVQRFDDAFLRTMVAHRAGWLTSIAKVLNVLGSVTVLLPIRIVAALYLMIRRRWWHALAFVSEIVISEVVTSLMKSAYDRPRPLGALVHTTGASFPSGHAVATTTTAVALVIAFFPTGRQRAVWGTAAAIFSFLMAMSRAYLAAHWLSDAVAGTLIGVACALGPALIVEELRELQIRREERAASAAAASASASASVEPESDHPTGSAGAPAEPDTG